MWSRWMISYRKRNDASTSGPERSSSEWKRGDAGFVPGCGGLTISALVVDGWFEGFTDDWKSEYADGRDVCDVTRKED